MLGKGRGLGSLDSAPSFILREKNIGFLKPITKEFYHGNAKGIYFN